MFTIRASMIASRAMTTFNMAACAYNEDEPFNEGYRIPLVTGDMPSWRLTSIDSHGCRMYNAEKIPSSSPINPDMFWGYAHKGVSMAAFTLRPVDDIEWMVLHQQIIKRLKHLDEVGPDGGLDDLDPDYARILSHRDAVLVNILDNFMIRDISSTIVEYWQPDVPIIHISHITRTVPPPMRWADEMPRYTRAAESDTPVPEAFLQLHRARRNRMR